MLSSEVMKKCQLTKKAIKYYIEQDLIQPTILENGYRDFSQRDVEKLNQIRLYRQLGLTVGEIKMVFNDFTCLKQITNKQMIHLEKEKIKLNLLKKVIENQSIISYQKEIDELGLNTIIAYQFEELFPGYFGKMLSLYFSPYLQFELENSQQEEAFLNIIDFFDNAPQIELTEEIKQYLDDLMNSDYLEQLEHVFKQKNQAVENVEQFVKDNKEILDTYQAFKSSKEYLNSPMYQIMELMKQMMAANGYDDIFIPNMRKLSPMYNDYYEKLLAANEQFINLMEKGNTVV